jgi:hypothetical protein
MGREGEDMGQIVISTEKYEILTGYDHPLGQFFLVVEDKSDNLIFSNLRILSGAGMKMSHLEVLRFIQGLGVHFQQGTSLEQHLIQDEKSTVRNQKIRISASDLDDQ